MDREKVIKGLQEIVDDKWMKSHADWYVSVCSDALALLKEQEEKRTPKLIIHGDMEEYWGEEEICPDCGKKWQSADIDTTHFCPGCGRRVQWE